MAKNDNFQFVEPFHTSLRASAHTGVAIPTDRGCMGYLKGIPTPVCGLVREDVKIKQPVKLQSTVLLIVRIAPKGRFLCQFMEKPGFFVAGSGQTDERSL